MPEGKPQTAGSAEGGDRLARGAQRPTEDAGPSEERARGSAGGGEQPIADRGERTSGAAPPEGVEAELPGVEPRFDLVLGITTRFPAPGTCVAELALAPQHRNIEGRIHGGVLLTVLDTAMGHAIASVRRREGITAAATIQFSCQFLRPPAGGQLEARGTVVRLGGSSAFVEGILRDGEGAEVARAHGVWRVWRAPGESR